MPIALQHLKKKWFMTILFIQVEDILRQITPPQQVGCIKGIQIQHHIWGVRGEWVNADDTMLLTIDYRNAFPTLSHNFIQATLNFFSFPPIGMFVKLVIAFLLSQYHFFVGCGNQRSYLLSGSMYWSRGPILPPNVFLLCGNCYPPTASIPSAAGVVLLPPPPPANSQPLRTPPPPETVTSMFF